MCISIIICLIVLLFFYLIMKSKIENETSNNKSVFFNSYNMYKKYLSDSYGQIVQEIFPDKYDIKQAIFVFHTQKIIVFNKIVYNYSEILDFNVREDSIGGQTEKTKTSTSSLIGRGLVGGVLLGGVGALIGASTANTHTIKVSPEVKIYYIDITTNNMDSPLYTYITVTSAKAQKLVSILTIILEINNKNK